MFIRPLLALLIAILILAMCGVSINELILISAYAISVWIAWTLPSMVAQYDNFKAGKARRRPRI